MESSEVPKILEDDVISKNFKGRLRQIITFQGADGLQKVKETVIDSFAAILIRVVGFKEIYEAWEQQYQSFIDEYKENDVGLNKDQTCQAKQKEWLEQVPKVLCLQTNRLEYKDNELFKHRHKV